MGHLTPFTHGMGRVSMDEILTLMEAANYCKKSRVTIWRWCQSGRLKAIRVGRVYRVRKSELDGLMGQSIDADPR